MLLDDKKKKNGKVNGPDRIYAEMFKVHFECSKASENEITRAFNKIYATGINPRDWL